MKTKHFYLAIMSLAILSCGKGDNKVIIDDLTGKNIGTHKIVLEINSDQEILYSVAFVGVSGKGLPDLYDGDGNPVSQTWGFSDTSTNKSKVVCQTDSKAINLHCSLSISYLGISSTATCNLKAYVNEKLVREVSRELNFTPGHSVEVLSFTTSPSE